MSDWDAIVKVTYSDREDKIIEESEEIGEDLQELAESQYEKAERARDRLSASEAIAYQESAEQLEKLIDGYGET